MFVVVRCLGLLAAHELEVVDLLELGDDELAVHVVHLQLQGVDLHLVLLHLGCKKKTTNERRARAKIKPPMGAREKKSVRSGLANECLAR